MNTFEALETYLTMEMLRREHIMRRDTECNAPPHQFYVEPTNLCNYKCIMCAPLSKRGKPGYLPMERWQQIIDAMAAHGLTSPITMIGRGEPLLHKGIVDMVAYAADRNVPCYIITNGSRLDEKLAKGLLQAGVKKIQFSLHAHSPETFKKITNRDNYEKVKSNILRLMELKKELNSSCFISVMAVESEINTLEIENFKAYWSEKVDRCFVTGLYSIQGDSSMADEARSRPDLIKKHPDCVLPWYFMGFRLNGDITPCPFDFEQDYVIGNVDDPGFDIMAVWNGNEMRTFRNCHAQRDFTHTDAKNYPCRICEVPRTKDGCKGLEEWVEKFPSVFARQFAPLIR